MFLLLLLLTTAQANGLSDRSPRPDTGLQIPPGVEVLGYDIGPGLQVALRLEQESAAGLIPESRARIGDWERDTSHYAASGEIRNPSMEASMSRDPFLDYSPTWTPDHYTSYALRPEKVTFAAAVIRNSGTKAIKIIDWDLPYPHIRNNQPALRYALRSHTIIKPGETKTIREPMPRTLRGFNISKGNGAKRTVTFISSQDGISLTVPIDCLREGAQITRIKYSDGSIWQHP